MKLKGSFFVIIMLLAVVAYAQVPRVISYQGVLTASPGGSPVNGMRNLGFALYESEDDFATPTWTETHLGVHVQHSVFAVYLGSATPFPSSVDFSKQYWLGISIDGGAELTPRFHLTASPYAMNIPSMGAEDGQVLKWNATDEKWEPASIKIEEECSTCITQSDSDSACVEWKYDGNGVIWTALDYDSLQTCSLAYVGIAKGHAGNTIDGVRKTHVNLGAYSKAGATASTDSFCTVSGGKRNEALNDFATIAGGDSNIVHEMWGVVVGGLSNVDSAQLGFIGGGRLNILEEAAYASAICGGEQNRITHDYAFIGGGSGNLADSVYTVVAGGSGNWANYPHAAICGGRDNYAMYRSFVGGGQENEADQWYTVIAGGYLNTIKGCGSAITGGYANFDSTMWSYIGGGYSNSIIGGSSNPYSVIGGGYFNEISKGYSTIAGGSRNEITSEIGFIGGGSDNIASGRRFSAVVGGFENTSSGDQSFVGGGMDNTASGRDAMVGGGYSNTASSDRCAIAGGAGNTVAGANGFIGGGYINHIATGETYGAIAGGRNNLIDADYSFIGGGYADTILADSSVIAGGIANKIQAPVSFIGGGSNNHIAPAGTLSVIGGGLANIDSSTYSFIGGGGSNVILSGGKYNTIAGGWKNTANGRYATVGGGRLNTASEYYSTVCGGDSNTVKSIYSTIGGGLWNTIDETGGNNVICGGRGNYINPQYGSGGYSTIIGGSYDTLESNWSMVFGRYVYNEEDYRVHFFECGYGGQLFINHDDHDGAVSNTHIIHVGCDEYTGNNAWLSNGGIWWNGSSRYIKDRFVTLDGLEVLNSISEMDIMSWYYIDTEERHISPFAEDFYRAFGTGVGEPENDSIYISASDMAGVSLRAIQELHRQINELREENALLHSRIDSLSASIDE